MHDMTLEAVSTEDAVSELEALGSGWTINTQGHLTLLKGTANFSAGVEWINRIAEIANELNHHPDVYLSFKKVQLDLYSHKLDGLCEADFELARRIDKLG